MPALRIQLAQTSDLLALRRGALGGGLHGAYRKHIRTRSVDLVGLGQDASRARKVLAPGWPAPS